VSHLKDDDLVLHYYGEDGSRLVAVERHLQSCAQCARAYEDLARTLNAVRAPEFVEPADDTLVIRQLIRERLNGELSPLDEREPAFAVQVGVITLAWLVPLVYPLAVRALFGSGQWAQRQVAFIPLVVLALIWACAGPALAVFALNHVADRGARRSTRVLVMRGEQV